MMIFFFFFSPMILAVCLFSPLSSDQEQSTLSLCLGCLMEERVCLLQERKRRLSRMNPNLLMSLFLVKADNKLLSALISRPAEQTCSDLWRWSVAQISAKTLVYMLSQGIEIAVAVGLKLGTDDYDSLKLFRDAWLTFSHLPTVSGSVMWSRVTCDQVLTWIYIWTAQMIPSHAASTEL